MPISLEQFRAARKTLPVNEPVQVNHNGKVNEYENALAFFNNAGCPPELVQALLDEQGHWQYQHPEQEIYSLGPKKLNKYLKTILRPIYGIANSSLDAIFDYGFNRHDLEHIINVVKGAQSLLNSVRYSKKEQKKGQPETDQLVATIAAWYHDAGNIFSRKFHSLISSRIALLHNPHLKDNPQLFRQIRRAIQLHNEPIAAQLLQSLETQLLEQRAQEQSVSDITEADRIELLRTHFGRAALALIISDKSDIGRHRISMKARHHEAVNFDQHLEVNLLGLTDSIGLNKKGDAFVWRLLFTPSKYTRKGKKDNDLFLVDSRTKEAKLKARVSNQTQEMLRVNGFSHMDSWSSLFWTLYLERIILTVRAAFALHPEINEFKIKVSDEEGLETRRWVFERDQLDRQFQLIRQKYNRHKETRKRETSAPEASQPVEKGVE